MYTGETFGLSGASAQASGLLRQAAVVKDQKILKKRTFQQTSQHPELLPASISRLEMTHGQGISLVNPERGTAPALFAPSLAK